MLCLCCGLHPCTSPLDGFQVLQLLPGGQDRASAPNISGQQDQHEAAIHADRIRSWKRCCGDISDAAETSKEEETKTAAAYQNSVEVDWIDDVYVVFLQKSEQIMPPCHVHVLKGKRITGILDLFTVDQNVKLLWL